jgi:hypothetical protein
MHHSPCAFTVCCRFEDLPIKARAQLRWQKVVALIPHRGGADTAAGAQQEPEGHEGAAPVHGSCFDAFFLPLFHDLQRYMPALAIEAEGAHVWPPFSLPVEHRCQGLMVTPVLRQADGQCTLAGSFRLHLVLMGVFADSPARCKLMMSVPMSSSLLGCSRCCMNAVRVHNRQLWAGCSKAVIRRPGYNCHLAQTHIHGNACWCEDGDPQQSPRDILLFDNRRLISNAEQLERDRSACDLAERGPVDYNKLGTWGHFILPQLLPYLSYNNICFLPFAHAFFRGVLNDFLRCIQQTKKTLTAAAAPDLAAHEGLLALHVPPHDQAAYDRLGPTKRPRAANRTCEHVGHLHFS